MRGAASTPGRTVAIWTGESQWMAATVRPPKAGFQRHESVVDDVELDGVAGEPGAEGGGGPRGDLTTPRRAGHQHRPRPTAAAHR